VEQVTAASAPPPEPDELQVTIDGAITLGEPLSIDPLQPITVTLTDGSAILLDSESASTEIWSPLLGSSDPGWLSVGAEYLWPGATLYVRLNAPPAPADSGAPVATANSVRIVAAPALERVALEDGSDIASEIASQTALALVGTGDSPGMSLLTASGGVSPQWADGQVATWLGESDEDGFVVSTQFDRYSPSGFVWIRPDGAGLRIAAQPWFEIRGVSGDPYTGLWWIERPMSNSGVWQLWNWDPSQQRVVLRLSESTSVFAAASPIAGTDLLPRLLMLNPDVAGDPANSTFYVDTIDAQTLQLNAGVFRLRVAAPAGQSGVLSTPPQVVLAPDTYRSPLTVSPDRTRLVYSVYDADLPSLTSGQVTPANRLKSLDLETSAIQTIYQAETALEFVAPLLAWQDSNTLLTARSRFAAAGTLGLDLFGAVWIQLPRAGQNEEPSAFSAGIPASRKLLDFAGCREQQSALLVLLNDDGSLDYARWNGFQPIQTAFTVPNNLTRATLCWRLPEP
jgi:hypothetical protein